MKRYELLKQAMNNHGYCSVDKQNMDIIEEEIRADERKKIAETISAYITLCEVVKDMLPQLLEIYEKIAEQMKGGVK